MEYEYIPDTFDYVLIIKKFGSKQNFLEVQVKYKRAFESYLRQFLNLEKIQQIITSAGVDIPQIEDMSSNFYYSYSQLGNSYIYIRNNYHVENLSYEELEALENGPSEKFFADTYREVLFERGDMTFYGIPHKETEVPTQSIVFEFAFEQSQCQSIEQLKIINDVIKQCQDTISSSLLEKLGIPASFIVYDGLSKQYKVNSAPIIN